ncbi:MAG: hypothetical protein FJ096_07255 [Deltaproteobacteria bacterium]|nr:hypothetical protein [Deltaproteobacteria bacterium]
MKVTLLVASLGLLVGCATPLRSIPLAEEPGERVFEPDASAALASAPMRLPGDYVVYRLSGAHRSEPATIVQRVRSRTGGVLKLDVTVMDGPRHEVFRVRVDDGRRPGSLLSVGRVRDGHLEPFGVVAYEARMATLVPSADANEGVTARSGEVVHVGGMSLFSLRTDYRVRVGAQRATMSTFGLAGFPGENLGGRIIADDGTVLYQAQLVELGNELPSLEPASQAYATSDAGLPDLVDE